MSQCMGFLIFKGIVEEVKGIVEKVKGIVEEVR